MTYQAEALSAYPFLLKPVWTSFEDAIFPTASILGHTNAPASGVWTTGNTAVAIPFQVPYSITVVKLGWVNGSSAGNAWDIGLYNASTNARLTSIGSTTGSGNSSWQWVNTADVTLVPGTPYWLAVNHATTTANNAFGTSAANAVLGFDLLAKIKVQAVGAVTLPDPFVPADPAAAVLIPLCGMAFNTTFV